MLKLNRYDRGKKFPVAVGLAEITGITYRAVAAVRVIGLHPLKSVCNPNKTKPFLVTVFTIN